MYIELHFPSGTKRLPGAYKSKERSAPRIVKTYQERLREMKSSRPVGQWQPPRTQRRPSAGAASRRAPPPPAVRAVPRKPRKTKTYAEQLQELQPPKDMYRTGGFTSSRFNLAKFKSHLMQS